MSAKTWDGRPSPYWQHETPLRCPKRHVMGWLGSVFWFCVTCKPKTIWAQKPSARRATGQGEGP
jgi:hypothetical protein